MDIRSGLLLTILGACRDKDPADDRYNEGYAAGLEDGYAEGYTDGLAEGGSTAADAWALYAEGWHEEACAAFLAVASAEGASAGLYDGLGWCNIKQRLYSPAESYFDLALSLDPTHGDARAGRAAARSLQGRFADAAEDEAALLEAAPAWTSGHEALDAEDLRRALARDMLFAGQSVAADKVLVAMGGGYSLNPHDPASWVVGGSSYSSFERAALAWLVEVAS